MRYTWTLQDLAVLHLTHLYHPWTSLLRAAQDTPGYTKIPQSFQAIEKAHLLQTLDHTEFAAESSQLKVGHSVTYCFPTLHMASSNLAELRRARGHVKGQLTRTVTRIKGLDPADLDSLQFYKQKLTDLYSQFIRVQSDIQLQDDTETQSNEVLDFENIYESNAISISRRIRILTEARVQPISEQFPTRPESAQSCCINTSLIPKIDMPSFNGNPDDWYSFRDTFRSIIHENDNIPVVQKFHLLKNAFKDEIGNSIKNITASAENYQVAWDLLQKRCDIPRRVINAHLKAILDIPVSIANSPIAIQALIDEVETRVRDLQALGQPAQHWDSLLVHIILRKLDTHTRRAWEQTLENTDIPKYSDLIEFLTNRTRGNPTEVVSRGSESNLLPRTQNHFQHRLRSSQTFVAMGNITCGICKEDHATRSCAKLMKAFVKLRINLIKEAKLCLNCLCAGHFIGECQAGNCQKCNVKHHTLLHLTIPTTESQVNEANQADWQDFRQLLSLYSSRNSSEILLGTAVIQILDQAGVEHSCRVLLDSGSQGNFMTETLADKLQLRKKETHFKISGLSNIRTSSLHTITTTIRSNDREFEEKATFFTLSVITKHLPSRTLRGSDLEIPSHIKLADPAFYISGPIDALLGNTLFYRLISVGQLHLNNEKITLQKTRLGWIVTGNLDTNPRQHHPRRHRINSALEQQMKRFWQIENVQGVRKLSPSEQLAEEHFSKHTCRDTTGRYIVRLPFNSDHHRLGNSYELAHRRFIELERRLAQNPELREHYFKFILEYQSLEHMSNITSIDDRSSGYYLPHHAVFKEDSATTKIRVIFDGSASPLGGFSLNNTLLVGPTIQQDLFSLTIRFRTHRYALTAGIEKIYRQIRVDPKDAIYQKILWRDSPDTDFQVFRLDTVAYGTDAAPFFAVRCLNQLVKDDGHRYPTAARVLERDFYMDDLLTGTSCKESAIRLRDDLNNLTRLGGFHLRQWTSNDASFTPEPSDEQSSFELDRSEQSKTLGTIWNPLQDIFRFRVHTSKPICRLTKRHIWGEIARIFDPLGLVGPVIVEGKLLMQQLWLEKVQWDESVPYVIHTRWHKFLQDLLALNCIDVPRRVLIDNATKIELHGFCNASEKAYGACLYLKSTNTSGDNLIQLLCSKTRVARLKSVSLSRLELCAANVLANLFHSVIPILDLKVDACIFWSDSTITLQCLNGSHHGLKTFLANRVATIQELTINHTWRYVPSVDNPADLLSHGHRPSFLKQSKLWWHGPKWLKDSENIWPKSHLISDDNLPDLQNIVVQVSYSSPKFDILHRFSKFTKLIRVVAICLRWSQNYKSRRATPISAEEISHAHAVVIRLTQKEVFSLEIATLARTNELSENSPLRSLNPFLDTNQILRVGARVRHAPVSYKAKFCIILPKNHVVTELIIHREHVKHDHAGVQATLNAIHRNYWPLGARKNVRRFVYKCTTCARMKSITPKYRMGGFPTQRVTITRPFEHTGMYYCGPFYIKEWKLRNRVKVKIYVSVFICIVTKAVHLEFVSDFTTDACLAALRRFFSCRGKPTHLYSDNGTNFVDAWNQIKELQLLLEDSNHYTKLTETLATDLVYWHMNPPRSPHFGSLWEAAVKSFIRHFYRIAKDTLLTCTQFCTMLTEIVGIFNSRPISPISSDPSDLNALTPAHFLIGDRMTSLSEQKLSAISTNQVNVWQQLETLRQQFWKRWQQEYLQEMHTRSKWYTGDQDLIRVGTLVLLNDKNLAPTQWKLGRITHADPGTDGRVRVVDIKTATGIITRAVKYLCPLPIADQPAQPTREVPNLFEP